MGHTPGPWENQDSRDGGRSRSIIGTDDKGQWQIASVNLCMASESEANARLIAAAPDLLEALEAAAIILSGEEMTKSGLIKALEMARDAIAKAKGGKP